jgi:hypothetical protein
LFELTSGRVLLQEAQLIGSARQTDLLTISEAEAEVGTRNEVFVIC